MNPGIKKSIKYWGYLLPYAHIPRNEAEYDKLLNFMDELMEASRHNKDDQRITSFLKLIAQNIEAYEMQHYSTKTMSSIDMLEFLMNEHHLSQSDLPEIGSQSLISKILSGERQLTVDHIRSLAKRFGVSPSVFY